MGVLGEIIDTLFDTLFDGHLRSATEHFLGFARVRAIAFNVAQSWRVVIDCRHLVMDRCSISPVGTPDQQKKNLLTLCNFADSSMLKACYIALQIRWRFSIDGVTPVFALNKFQGGTPEDLAEVTPYLLSAPPECPAHEGASS